MINLRDNGLLLAGFVVLLALAQPVAAFGAGNIASISKVEGQNWRHGDIEDVLLTLSMARAMRGQKFNKLNVSRVYFGNWLRDYSQAIDMGTVKMVSAEAIRLLLCVLGFMTFGYGSGEFEVTAERLGCYRPEEHIDNPKGYGEGEDPRNYHRALRGPIDERRELSVDPETGMKNYIANDNAGIQTSSAHIKNLLRSTVELTRRYNRNKRDEDFYEALRLMGTGLHCLEDFFAHSNYCELALIEIGEKDVFPHCGRRTQIRLEGAQEPVYPIVTGTFGGVDFLHSVTGEVSDKLTQNEIDELETTLNESQKADTSLLRDLLDKIPDGIFGGKHESDRIDELQQNANNSQMQNVSVSPREPEEFTRYVQNLFRQVMPAIEFHDEVMKSLTAALEKIPVLPKILEQLEEHLTVFVFSLIAPMLLPLINQIKNELKTGSEQLIESSENEQHIVFNDDSSDNPTHSMLSKDHFSNILNELAGQCSAKMLHWAVPQLMEAIDDENSDVERVLDDIVNGVLHHPAQRDNGRGKAHDGRRQIYQVVKEWWREMSDERRDDYRRRLSRDGVRNHKNHKEGVHDTGHGHGCVGKLKMQKLYGQPETLEDKIAGHAAEAIFKGATGLISGALDNNSGSGSSKKDEGGLGGLLGAAGSLLGSAFRKDEKESESSSGRNNDGSYTRTEHESGRHGDHYAEATLSHTTHPGGGEAASYHSTHQQSSSGGGYTASSYTRTETRPSGGGAYAHSEQHSSTTHGYGGGRDDYAQSSSRHDGSHTSGGYGSSGRRDKDKDDDSEDSSSSKKKYKKEKKKNRRKSNDSKDSKDSDDERRKPHGSSYNSGGYGGSSRRDDEDRTSGGYGSHSGRRDDDRTSGYGSSDRRDEGHSGTYGGGHQQSYGSSGRDEYGSSTSGGYGSSNRRDDDRSSGYGSGGQHQSGGYGSHEQSSYGGRQEQSSYSGRQEHSSYGGRDEQPTYGGRQEQSSYGRQDQSSYGRQEQSSYGGSHQSGYGGSSGGYGGGQESSHGGSTGGYGRQEQSQYGSSGGYGQHQDERQGHGRDDERSGEYGQGGYGGNNSSSYGGGSGYGSGGYGGSDRRY